MKKITNEKSQDALLKAVRLLLRPLVRLLIKHQITFPYIRDLLKEIYIDVAGEIIETEGTAINNSRIYIMTGVHRKDIKRIRELDSDTSLAGVNLSLGGQLIAQWSALPEFLESDGRPKKLRRSGSDDEPGFDQLVEAVSKDVRPRAMLDEWLRQGIVKIEDDFVMLNESAFIPSQDFEKLSYYLGHNLHDHLASSAHNLSQENEPFLERSVYYGKLTEASVDTLRHSAKQKSMQLLTDINQQAMALYQLDQEKPDATHRFRLGCYWFEQDKNL